MPLVACTSTSLSTLDTSSPFNDTYTWRRIITNPARSVSHSDRMTHSAASPTSPLVHRVPGWLRFLLRSRFIRESAERLIHSHQNENGASTASDMTGSNAAAASASSSPDSSALVYVHQRELAIVSPFLRQRTKEANGTIEGASAKTTDTNPAVSSSTSATDTSSLSTPAIRSSISYIGSGDATTCVIVMLVSRATQRTIVAHLDGAAKTQISRERRRENGEFTKGVMPGSIALPSSFDSSCTSLEDALNRFTLSDLQDGIDVHLAGGFQTNAQDAKEYEGEDDGEEFLEKDGAHNQAHGSASIPTSASPVASDSRESFSAHEDDHDDEDDDDDEEDEHDQRDGLLQVRDILDFLHRYRSPALSGNAQANGIPNAAAATNPVNELRMYIQTLCVGPLNTQWKAEKSVDSNPSALQTSSAALAALAYPRPFVTSLFYHVPTRRVIHTFPSGSLLDSRDSRGPAMVLRCIRGFLGPDELSHVYDERSDQFWIRPFQYSRMNSSGLRSLLALPDSEFLLRNSTSPSCEPPNFLPDMRQTFSWLIDHPRWQESFPQGEHHVRKFDRICDNRNVGWNVWKEIMPIDNQIR